MYVFDGGIFMIFKPTVQMHEPHRLLSPEEAFFIE